MRPGHVRIAVDACGVNFPDTLIVQGKYQFRPPPPFSPGGEVAGRIVEIADDVRGLETGQRVIAVMIFGGFAEQVVVPATGIIPIPETMDAETAAAFMITYGTSMHALAQRGRIREGETLLVLGAAGGVGLAAVELGKQFGARVIAAASSADKIAVALEHGAHEAINYREEDLVERVKAITDNRGADVIYDPVGGDATTQALRSIAWRGRLLIVGFASGQIPEIPANRLLLKGCEATGVFWGNFIQREPSVSRDNVERLFSMHARGALRPRVSRTFPLEQASDALECLQRREAIGKLVLVTGNAANP
jgi:NADPH2:quinone reductase